MHTTRSERRSACAGGLSALVVLGTVLAASPRTAGQCWEDQLIPADAELYDMFGWSLGISADGTVAAIGAHGADPRGRVYIYQRFDGRWVEGHKLVRQGDPRQIGYVIAMHPNGSEVATLGYSSTILTIFRRVGGTWIQHDSIDVLSLGANPALAYSGDGSTLVVGTGKDRGEVRVYAEVGGTWTLEDSLIRHELSDDARLGNSLAVSHDGNTIVAGSYLDRDGSGKAIVFARGPAGWTFEASLLPPPGTETIQFGLSAALTSDGDTAYVGSRTSLAAGITGRIVMFERESGNWTQVGVVDPLLRWGDYAIVEWIECSADGTSLVFGDSGDDDIADSGGAVYICRLEEGAYELQQKLTPADVRVLDSFGYRMDITPDGHHLLASSPFGGAPQDQNSLGTGTVYAINVDDCGPQSMGDLDGDNDVDIDDLGILLDAYERTPAGDCDGDDDTDQEDLGILLSNYGMGL